jgi:hypothetical protein
MDDNFEWLLIAVYGAAQEVEKEDFLSELVWHVLQKIFHS